MTNKAKSKREYVNEIKTTVGCNKCGKDEPVERLHFHHVEGKTKVDAVANMVDDGYSLEKIQNEIRKCKVLCSECHTAHHYGRSKQDCIDAIQEVAEELGKSPTNKEYIEHSKDNHPSTDTINRKLGSWNEAKEAAGLGVFENRSIPHIEQDCIDALREVAETLGKSLSRNEYREHSEDNHPSPNTMCRKFGSWNEAKQVAGLSVYQHDTNTSYTEQDCIDAIQEVADELDKSPLEREYIEHSKDNHPSSITIKKKIGSWNEAKQVAGLSVFEVTEQDCIDTIQEVADELDKSPSVSEYREHKEDNHPSSKTIEDKFGSWNEAKEAAGLSVFEHGSGKAVSPSTKGQTSFNQFS